MKNWQHETILLACVVQVSCPSWCRAGTWQTASSVGSGLPRRSSRGLAAPTLQTFSTRVRCILPHATSGGRSARPPAGRLRLRTECDTSVSQCFYSENICKWQLYRGLAWCLGYSPFIWGVILIQSWSWKALWCSLALCDHVNICKERWKLCTKRKKTHESKYLSWSG